MAENELRTWSFLGLLIGGILILAGGLMGALMMGAYGWMGAAPMSSMMGSYASDAWVANVSLWMGGVGLLTGGLVLLAAHQVYRNRETRLWSVVAIVAGALSLFAMGGFVVGAVAAIAGGALGLLDQQQKAPRAGGA